MVKVLFIILILLAQCNIVTCDITRQHNMFCRKYNTGSCKLISLY